MLLGLQSNALKFTEQGFVKIVAEIIMKDGSQYLKISVIDSGVGIAKDNQDKLFKLFGFLEDNQEMNTNGIGLGLMISKLIVEKFDGNITFESEPEEGSKFMFTFKLEQADDQSL